MRSVDVYLGMYIDYGVYHNDKDLKFNVGEHERILKYKNIFAKGWTPLWSEEVFIEKKVKNTASWACVITNLNDAKIVRAFYEKKLLKSSQREFKVEKVIK